jgi:hypothetical protein
MDKGRAVVALRSVRELHSRFAPEPPVRVERPIVDAPELPPRPLGRLEQIDLIKPAQPKRKRRSAV